MLSTTPEHNQGICVYCDNPGQFGLLPAQIMDIEKWGRFGDILINELNGQPLQDAVNKEPLRAWASKTVQILMHPNKFPVSCGPKGIHCKRSVAD